MLRWVLIAGLLLLGSCLASVQAALGQDGDPKAGVEFFERKIRPLLVQHCYECHSAKSKLLQGGLRLDHRAGFLQGGDSGPSVVPGKPEESSLIAAIGYEGDTQMPPKGKLPAEEIKLLTEWVRRGAPLPEDQSSAVAKAGIDFAAGRKFWSFQPPRRVDPTAVKNADWIQRPMDAFILAALEKQQLAPSPPASRSVMIRRAMFDLVGLPPTPEEIAQFESDASPDAYEQLIERLLASPHYGERWARYWLDLARVHGQDAFVARVGGGGVAVSRLGRASLE